ncbi:hypothetical protein LSPH24S_02470 [Lysinibacillus sphaericus]
MQAENPLVILIDGHLTDIVKTKGFLISLASSGNIVFFDEDHLQAALANSVMKSSITSINGIADVALETAQRFKQQYVYYIVAGLLIFVTMLLTAVLNGRLWAGTNGKRLSPCTPLVTHTHQLSDGFKATTISFLLNKVLLSCTPWLRECILQAVNTLSLLLRRNRNVENWDYL